MLRLLLASTVLLAAPLMAQATSWNIPERGVVEYERDTGPFSYTRPPNPNLDRGYTALKTGAEGGEIWRYTLDKQAAGWFEPGFTDTGWSTGRSGFGGSTETDEHQRTVWKGDYSTIHLRTVFEVGVEQPVEAAVITVSHDDGVKIWLNGQLVVDDNSYHRDETKVLRPEDVGHIKPGINHLAVQCTNGLGAQLIDVGLRLYERPVKKFEAQGLRERAGLAERNDMFGPMRPPPLLFQSDLDGKQLRPTRTPWDLRQVAAFVAFDLTAAKAPQRSVKIKCPRLPHFGDLLIHGKAGRMGVDGRQELSLKLRSTEPARDGDSKRYMGSHVYRYCPLRLNGTLIIERDVDWQRGLVTRFSARIEATSRTDGGGADSERILRWQETWTLARVRANRDAQFRQDVVEAIARGSDWVKEDLADVSIKHVSGAPVDHYAKSANSGRLALGLLALIKADVPRDDPVVVGGLTELKRRDIQDTYSLGNALGALEAFYAPLGERDNLIDGTISRPRLRELPPEDMAVVERWSEQLIDNIDKRVDQEYLVRFNYTPGHRYDNSVNQYGLLGLYSAHLCGLEISSSLWQAAADHLINDQVVSSQNLRLLVKTHQDLRAKEFTMLARTVSPRRVRVGGWGYMGPWNGMRPPVSGSMTTAGLSGLLICRAALSDLGLKRATVLTKIDRALDQGYAWLGANFDVGANPGDLGRAHHWTYYYLYGLERACELAAVAHIQGHDWYFEGAMNLLHWQRESGEWPPEHRTHGDAHGFGVERTSFALLFLKKSALPVHSLRRK